MVLLADFRVRFRGRVVWEVIHRFSKPLPTSRVGVVFVRWVLDCH